MISIVISSYKEDYYKLICQNISETIGTPYEIIKVDNPGIYSVTQAYNIGASRAKYQILCFIHEDIKFHSDRWGDNLIKHFSIINNLGLVGIAGSEKKLALPTGWGYFDDTKNQINIIHRDAKGDAYRLSTFKNNIAAEVRVIDGVFMACTKNVWDEFKFDENIPGYHLYDLDFSLRVSQKYKVLVVPDILVEHFSHGNFGDDWVLATIDYHKRADKAYLFDTLDSNVKLKRLPYYLLMAKNDVSLKLKIEYIKNLGVDARSIAALLWFLFPPVGNFFYKYYKMIF